MGRIKWFIPVSSPANTVEVVCLITFTRATKNPASLTRNFPGSKIRVSSFPYSLQNLLKRADSIVKGMLQHSRSGDGKKEPTDLNALADEYFRLAYHGLRAKDKSFNATMETDFDPNLPEVNVVPQDIGRVLLNLITNAFHAVNDRKASATEGYQPSVRVRTRKTNDGVEISVRDNGGGIPESIREKMRLSASGMAAIRL